MSNHAELARIMANGTSVGGLSRRIMAAGFVMLLLTAGLSITFIQLSGSLQALAVVHAAEIGVMAFLTAGLLALGWFLRERVALPLDSLRRSLAAVEAGAFTQPVTGLDRTDEIGAVARAAERLRQAATGGESQGARGLQRLIERLSKDAARLEADLARLSSATSQARAGIEEASVRAAKASQVAIEVAGVVREGAQRMSLQAEESLAALDAAFGRLVPGVRAPRSEVGLDNRVTPPPSDLADHLGGDAEAEAVLASLAGGLQALERFARDRRTIAGESAAALTVALVEAIDRLNGVADRISATADLPAKDEAA
jgi:methyl-accepting chemotaxis protein